MRKYTEEFRRNTVELMKQIGITKACKEAKVSHCTIYRWCKEFEGSTPEQEEAVETNLNAMIEKNSSELPHADTIPSDSDADDTVTRLPRQWRCSSSRTLSFVKSSSTCGKPYK